MTTEAKHTSGPWRPEFQPAGKLVAHWDIFTSTGENLACLPEATQEADARLIAAAPELAAAVETLTQAFSAIARVVNLDEMIASGRPSERDSAERIQSIIAMGNDALTKAGLR